jgi:hypothetical protein
MQGGPCKAESDEKLTPDDSLEHLELTSNFQLRESTQHFFLFSPLLFFKIKPVGMGLLANGDHRVLSDRITQALLDLLIVQVSQCWY